MRPSIRTALVAVSLLVSLSAAGDEQTASRLSALLGSGDAGFQKAVEPRSFSFPDDHGPHPAFRNEWWYVTGNLGDERGRRFGFELTIFRFALAPGRPGADSEWRVNQVYIAHLAVTDVAEERFLVAERYSRAALGLAGAQAEPFRVWIDDWSIGVDDTESGRWRVRASDDEFGVDLWLTPSRAPVLNGVDGLSQKSDERGNASYYYSITRLATEGRLRVGDAEYAVSGLSWMDREWSSSALAADQVGWDWFALQLSDGSDLMFYSIRRSDGTTDRNSAGTIVRADGGTTPVSHDGISVSVRDEWDSPAGGRYPSRWTLRVPAEGLELEVTPAIPNQELFTTVRYWEGAVDVRGSRRGRALTGRGYVELTGYAGN